MEFVLLYYMEFVFVLFVRNDFTSLDAKTIF